MRKQIKKRMFNFLQIFYAGLLLWVSGYSTALSQEATLRINEFMALNSSTLADEAGDFSDWIEIYNPTDADINLLGWSLTDRKEEPKKWQFPQQMLSAKSYLVVFASNKNHAEAGQELHTNFAISGSGEYLALIKPDGDAATEFDPSFPEQKTDVSFAYYSGDYVATGIPTPGTANKLSDAGLLPPPDFSIQHGFYEQPFEVEITSELSEVQIYYTTDGSPPKPANWTEYTNPLQIAKTTLLRAVTVKSDVLTSRPTTSTYLFLNDVMNQPNAPPGYPAEWGPYAALPGTAIADYEMDPEVTQNPTYGPQMKEALLALPALSLVTDKNNFFSHSTDSVAGGIYIYTRAPDVNPNHPSALGDGWERPVSIEYFTGDDSEGFQIDAGIRLHGGHSRRAEKSAKHSFRLVFRSEYGPGRLEYPLFGDSETASYNALVLRAGFGNSWTHWKHSERLRSQYCHDLWAKDTQLEMGHLSGHGSFVHLYINGIYWGIYNPTEYLDKAYAESYLPGNEDDYDIIKDQEEVVDGTWTDWENMMDLAGTGLKDNTNYQLIQGNNPDGSPNPQYPAYVDVINLIDYMLMNFYGGNWDWDHHNWVAIRNRVQPGKGFQFFSWDAEHVLEEVTANDLNEYNAGCPSFLFQRLRANSDFLRLFADRVQLHCFNGGILTPEAAAQRWMNRAQQIDLAIIAESARWGDYRRDVHPYSTNDTFTLYTKEHWLAEQDFLLTEYFPNRTAVFINQLKQAGLFPRVSAPQFRVNDDLNFSKEIQKGDILTMSATAGDIYYTMDGLDPVQAQSDESGSTVIISESAEKRVCVPKTDLGTSWKTETNFDASDWQVCSGMPGGVGYDRVNSYQNLIKLDVSYDMSRFGNNANTSCYIRIKFSLTDSDLQKYKVLSLQARYDDGFAADLNGTRVAGANAPDNPAWNSASTDLHDANELESFNISSFAGNLVEGENLLAVQAFNRSTSSSDFLFNCRLLASEGNDSELSSSVMLYSDPVKLNQSAVVKARTLNGSEWSALTEAVFTLPSELFNLKLTEIHYHPLVENGVDGS
ncbi:chitobiase/beta-hexosaminidase C-terminal domain-containing protein, partial [bacterium]